MFGEEEDEDNAALIGDEDNDHDANGINEAEEEEVLAPEDDAEDQVNLLAPNAGFNNLGLAAAHQALIHREGPASFQPYIKPGCFPVRVGLLLP